MDRDGGRKALGRVATILMLPIILAMTVISFVLLLVSLPLLFVYKILLRILILKYWIREGKDVLFVYSDSPVWREYMLNEVLPLVRERAVVLNCSEQKSWKRSLAKAVFYAYKSNRNWNPMVLVFPKVGRVRQIRFHDAFKSWKVTRGPVDEMRESLIRELGLHGASGGWVK
jgi:hypothetical protein